MDANTPKTIRLVDNLEEAVRYDGPCAVRSFRAYMTRQEIQYAGPKQVMGHIGPTDEYRKSA